MYVCIEVFVCVEVCELYALECAGMCVWYMYVLRSLYVLLCVCVTFM